MMFVGFTSGLKRMSGVRFGAGVRVTKNNMWYILLVLMFVWLGRLMWYMLIGMGWMTFGMLWLMWKMLYGIGWLVYKAYFYLVKGAWIGGKRLYSFARSKIEERKAARESGEECANEQAALEEGVIK